jgi:hypothetical protein
LGIQYIHDCGFFFIQDSSQIPFLQFNIYTIEILYGTSTTGILSTLQTQVPASGPISTHVSLAPPPSSTYNPRIPPPINPIPAPKSYTHVTSQLPLIVYAPPLSTDFPARSTNPTSTNLTFYPQDTARLISKFTTLKEQREKGTIVCYPCGDLGHLSSICHNPIVYFSYDKIKHRSWQCRSVPPMIFSRPPLSLSLKSIKEANQAPLIKCFSMRLIRSS